MLFSKMSENAEIGWSKTYGTEIRTNDPAVTYGLDGRSCNQCIT